MGELNPGDVVICIDASDIPPPWVQLEAGKTYIIRRIQLADTPDAHCKNVHKKSKYVVWLVGVHNMTNGQAAKMHGLLTRWADIELGYSDSRFEKVEDIEIFEAVSQEQGILA